jgi:hypothetical protein
MHVQMHLHLRQDRRVARWRDCGPQISLAPLGTGADIHTGRDHGVPDRVKNGEFDDLYRGPDRIARYCA